MHGFHEIRSSEGVDIIGFHEIQNFGATVFMKSELPEA